MLRTAGRMTLLLACAAVIGGVVAPALGADKTAPADQATVAAVTAVLARMDDDDYHVREAASADVEKLPPEAVPLLEAAMAKGDLSPEVAARLEHVIPALRMHRAAALYEKAQYDGVVWERHLRIAAYLAGGHANPRWDAQAVQAIAIGTRLPATAYLPGEAARIQMACDRAMLLGCDDPLVRYMNLEARVSAQNMNPLSDPVMQELSPIVDAIWAAPYPGWIKIQVGLVRVELTVKSHHGHMEGSTLVEYKNELDRITALLPDVAAAPDFPQPLLRGAATALLKARSYVVTRNDAFEQYIAEFEPMITRCAHNKALPLTIIAEHRLKSVAEAGDDSQWDFQNRAFQLKDAGHRLRAAWELDPTDPAAPNLMLWLMKLKGANRDEMETWYKRAIEANPGNFAACHFKLQFLEAMPDRDDQGMLEFGRECQRTGDWQDRLPFILVDAHLIIAHYRKDGPTNDHLSDPEAWAEVENIYREYLARYPNAFRERSYFASLAWHTGHWETGNEQVKILGDNVMYDQFNGKAEFSYLRRKGMSEHK